MTGRGFCRSCFASRWKRRRSKPTSTAWVIILTLCFALDISLYSQQAPPKISYEGQQVAAIDLVARPGVDAGSLRSLVQQEANQPYSNEQVQRSIAALERTGQFSKVELNVIPDQGGLRLEFILEPAYYVGIIDFPGALKAFSYTRLLQIIDYPSEEPYQAERVESGKAALQQFLIHNGYFLATVDSRTEVDDTRQLVNVFYDVKLGRHARIGNIEIAGPPPTEIVQLENSLRSIRARLRGARLKQGQNYDPDRIAAAQRFLQQRLGQENYLAGRINLIRPTYDAKTNRAAIHFEITTGPVVTVRVSGARLSDKTLRRLVPIYQESAVDGELVQEGAQNIATYFQGKGFFDAQVTSAFNNDAAPLLTYSVQLGKRHRLVGTELSGNNRVPTGNLMSQLVVRKRRFPFWSHGTFSDDLVDRSVKNLETYYRNHGYGDAKVTVRTVDQEPNVYVTFQINEGTQTLVESIDVQGNKTQPLANLVPGGLAIKPGQPYSQVDANQDRSRVMAAYLTLGYPNVTFLSTVSQIGGDRHRVKVSYVIDEGPRVTVSRVIFTGQSHTQIPLIARTLGLQSESYLNERNLLASESNLYNLGIFDWDNVSPRKAITDQNAEDVLVRVHEAKRNTFGYGLGFESTPRSGSLSTGVLILPGLPTTSLPKGFTVNEKAIISPLGSIEYSRMNMRGRAETASVSALISRLDQKGTITYSDPYLRSLNWSSLFTLSMERTTQNPLFTARIGQGSFQIERQLDAAKTKRLQLRYTYQQTSLTDLLILNFVPTQDQSIHLSTVSGSFVQDTRDQPLDAHRGIYQSLDLRISPTVLRSSDNVWRFFGQASRYWQLAPWVVWANNVRLGLVSSFSGSHVPFSERFFSGGADSLRGFSLNGAGPQGDALLCSSATDQSSCTAQVAVPQGGRELFIVNSEGRFPIPLKSGLGGVLFYDGGNVYSSINLKHTFSEYSNTVGIGLRYATPVGPIRIDLGYQLNPVPGLRRTNLFVTLGQSF